MKINKSTLDNSYKIMTSVGIATTISIMMMFILFKKEFKPVTESAQIERLEVAVKKLEKMSLLKINIIRIEEENKKLKEEVNFYKEKNDFLQDKLKSIKSHGGKDVYSKNSHMDYFSRHK